ncbi:hypothetical protein [Caulobacter sp. S45]|jgi:hypothetical protein|uniref:hypothetical protein n=1 Tax=Caulobacter sp. S45 TaxID=1641861 RepID=UPI00131EA167|nr:hypothetical protein [Caulobacter sp. S45]
MFYGWQTFYQLTGSAAGALIGLLFIVATLTSGQGLSSLSQGARLFTTPTVFHFAMVLMISALALTPVAERRPSDLITVGCAVVGLVYAVGVAIRLGRFPDLTHWSDVWFYGVGPCVGYAGLALAAILASAGMAHAPYALALLLLALLMLAIRNAWDLVTWLAARRLTPGETSANGAARDSSGAD